MFGRMEKKKKRKSKKYIYICINLVGNKIWRMANIFKLSGNIIWRTPKKRKYWRELNLADFRQIVTYTGCQKLSSLQISRQNQDYQDQNIKTFHSELCLDSVQSFQDRNIPYLIRTAKMHKYIQGICLQQFFGIFICDIKNQDFDEIIQNMMTT